MKDKEKVVLLLICLGKQRPASLSRISLACGNTHVVSLPQLGSLQDGENPLLLNV